MPHKQERRLITFIDDAGLAPADKRKRGTIINDLLGWTDDGFVVHIPTGRLIGPPAGVSRVDDAKFVLHMLDQDPEGWESSRSYKFAEKLSPALHERLKKARDSYSGG